MNIKEIIQKSQHAQRNWDLSKSIPQEDIDLIVEAVTQCPSKQNISYYSVHFIQDRDLIEEIHNNTHGFSTNLGNVTKENSITNSQVLANLLLCFTKHEDSRLESKRFLQQFNQNLDQENLQEYNNLVETTDRNIAIGIASGYANFISNLLGYSTGYCGCFDSPSIQKLLDTDEQPLLLLGIGYPDTNKNRLEHHNDPTVKFPTLSKQTIPVYHR